MFSVVFIIPFVGVSLALLQYNWFPARVFVGDTYCYFSGMVFAIVGIIGHFPKLFDIFVTSNNQFCVFSSSVVHILPVRHSYPDLVLRMV